VDGSVTVSFFSFFHCIIFGIFFMTMCLKNTKNENLQIFNEKLLKSFKFSINNNFAKIIAITYEGENAVE